MNALTRPQSLDESQSYLLRLTQNASPKPVYLPVRFAGYQPCPALIIVRPLQGGFSLRNVPRDDLFSEVNGL